MALESYLRRFPYTLDLAPPPPGRDIADYFLFDLQRGYCDYYATTMVVMARSVGLPARLAVGFASGIYDAANDRYIVQEISAHSWVEIYFTGVGWVNFEPTAGLPAIERDANALTQAGVGITQFEPLPADRAAINATRLRAAVLFGLVAVVLLMLGWAAADVWGLHQAQPTIAIQMIYLRVAERTSKRLGIDPDGLTPIEFANLYSGAGSRWTRIPGRAVVRKGLQAEFDWLLRLILKLCTGENQRGARLS